MDHQRIIENLQANLPVFRELLTNKSEKEYTWKPEQSKWCLLEIVCHLRDEEQEDFRTRVAYPLEDPTKPLPGIDPQGWVIEREYMKQDYNQVLNTFLDERRKSINFLRSLENPSWKNTTEHPILGPLSAEHFLANWLAHDYLHVRQIEKLQHQYLAATSGIDLSYAGNIP